MKTGHFHYDDKDALVKVDFVSMHQDNERLHGKISRFHPENQSYRRYAFDGRIRGKDFFAVFWSIDPSVISYGCWFLQQEDDRCFRGYYLRTHDLTKNISTVKLVMTRPNYYVIPSTKIRRIIGPILYMPLFRNIMAKKS